MAYHGLPLMGLAWISHEIQGLYGIISASTEDHGDELLTINGAFRSHGGYPNSWMVFVRENLIKMHDD